jgi:hypothetical protein
MDYLYVACLFLRPHVDDFERSFINLNDMTGSQGLSVDVIDIVRMENTGFVAIEDSLFARRIGEAKATPT